MVYSVWKQAAGSTWNLYKLTNQVNGKTYYGVTSQEPPIKRKWQHSCSDSWVGAAIRKHGSSAFTFEVIFTGDVKDVLAKEREIVNDDYLKSQKTYNRTIGGNGGGMVPASRSIKGKKNPMYGKTHTAEARAKISAATKGNVHWEHLRKVHDGNRGSGNGLAKAIVCYDFKTGEKLNEFGCISDAVREFAESLGKNPKSVSSNIRRVLYGIGKYAYGCKWEYLEST